jgi:hypothetical protein
LDKKPEFKPEAQDGADKQIARQKPGDLDERGNGYLLVQE